MTAMFIGRDDTTAYERATGGGDCDRGYNGRSGWGFHQGSFKAEMYSLMKGLSVKKMVGKRKKEDKIGWS